MKNLSDEDIRILKEMGYCDEDMEQIDAAISVTKITVDGVRASVSADKARELLGNKDFLSGMGRSAFHWSAVRKTKQNMTVYFDSSKLFR